MDIVTTLLQITFPCSCTLLATCGKHRSANRKVQSEITAILLMPAYMNVQLI